MGACDQKSNHLKSVILAYLPTERNLFPCKFQLHKCAKTHHPFYLVCVSHVRISIVGLNVVQFMTAHCQVKLNV